MSYEIINIYILPHASEFGLLYVKGKSSAVDHCRVYLVLLGEVIQRSRELKMTKDGTGTLY